MAGGVWKGFGFTFIIFGAIALLVGIGAAGFGAYMINEESNAGLFADQESADAGQTALVAGGISAAVGVVLLILGGIFLGVGGASSRRELMTLVATRGAQPPAAATIATAAPRATRSRWLAAGIIAAVVLLAAVVVAATAPEGSRTAAVFQSSSTTGGDARAVQSQDFDGHVRGVRAPVVGGFNAAGSSAPHTLAVAEGRYVVDGVLNWTTAAGGASSLTLILEVEAADGWTEIARGEGGPGLVVTSAPVDVAANVRARVFLGGAGAADQDYALTLAATPAQ